MSHDENIDDVPKLPQVQLRRSNRDNLL